MSAIDDVKVGRLNALVKILMRRMGVSDANEAVRLMNSGEWDVLKPPLLKPVFLVQVKQEAWFVVAEHLKSTDVTLTGDKDDRLRRSVETDGKNAFITASKLGKDSLDDQIKAELGKSARITLSHLFQVLAMRPTPLPGTDCIETVAYIGDDLRAVQVWWSSATQQWFMSSGSAEPRRKGACVLSRSSIPIY